MTDSQTHRVTLRKGRDRLGPFADLVCTCGRKNGQTDDCLRWERENVAPTPRTPVEPQVAALIGKHF